MAQQGKGSHWPLLLRLTAMFKARSRQRLRYETVEPRIMFAGDSTFQFDQASVVVRESGEYVGDELTITRSDASTIEFVRLVPVADTSATTSDVVTEEFYIYVTIRFDEGELTQPVPIRAAPPDYRSSWFPLQDVSTVDDTIHETDETFKLTMQTTDGKPITDGQSTVDVVIQDDDPIQLFVAETDSNTSVMVDGITDRVLVNLNYQPQTDVVVDVVPDSHWTASASQLVFTAENWNASQSVLLTGVEPGLATLTLSVDHAQSDPQFHDVEIVVFQSEVTAPLFFIEAVTDSRFHISDIDSRRTAGLTPYNLTNVNGELYFIANDGIHGWEPWKSDGTADGTTMVADIAAGSKSSALRDYQGQLATDGQSATLLGDEVLFFADDGIRGWGLWKSNVSTGSTEFIRFIDTFKGDQFILQPPHSLTVVGEFAYFAGGGTLWRTDGTEEGTVIAAQPNGWPSRLTSFNDTLYLQADWGFSRLKEDGRGTERVADIGSSPTGWYTIDDQLFLSTYDDTWVSDGSQAGTVRIVVDKRATTAPVDVNGTYYFTVGYRELWQTDGTQGGTQRVELPSSFSVPTPLGPVVNSATASHRLIFSDSNNGLWAWDGNEATLLAPMPGFAPAKATPLGDNLLLAMDDGVTGRELWITDGSPAGTRLLKDIYPGPNPGLGSSIELTPIGDKVYFQASDGTNGVELWVTDGTTEGTHIVKDYHRSESSVPSNIVALDSGAVIFSANDGHAEQTQLWKTDNGQTTLVSILPDPTDLGFDPFDGSPVEAFNVGLQEFVAHEDRVFFLQRYNYVWASGNFQHAFALWVTDGTTEGTQRLEKEAFSWFVEEERFDEPKITIDDQGQPQLLTTAIPFDGPVAPVNQQRSATIGEINFDVEQRLIGDQTVSGIFATVATGESILIQSRTDLAHTGHFSNIAGKLLFVSGNRRPDELWISDGTTVGTLLLKRFDEAIEIDSTVANGLLYFSVGPTDDGVLWRSDGTAAGTFALSDELRNPAELTQYNDSIYFTAIDTVVGRELWRTDGSELGTELVGDLLPGIASSSPQDLTVAGDSLYFSADHEQLGRELWRFDASNELPSLNEDLDSSGRVDFTDFLILSANFGKLGGLADGDITGDGMVGFEDFLRLSSKFGQASNVGTTS